METEAKKIEMNRARGVGAWSEDKWLKVHLQTIGPTNPDSLPQSVCHGFSILCPNYPDPDLLVYLRLRLRLYFAHCLLVPRLHLTSVLGPLSSFFFLPVGQSLGEFMLCVCVCVCVWYRQPQAFRCPCATKMKCSQQDGLQCLFD